VDGSLQANRDYYDAFAEEYESHRGDNDPGGYHEFLDELEADFVSHFGAGRDVLEVGCGTGLVLKRIAQFARSAKGLDLSPGMLARARARGLDVQLGSATELPFEDATFDVACSFKVLAHIPDIRAVLAEMARVVRPGGHVIAEFYNPWSLRGLVKRFGPAGRIATGKDESHVYTRFDSPWRVRSLTPSGCRLAQSRGVRIVTPTAHAMRVPLLRNALRRTERALCDTPLSSLGGFYVVAFRKEGAGR
jgi:ubiquinone/menaquinone biosynthesis C-methylase UbiE